MQSNAFVISRPNWSIAVFSLSLGSQCIAWYSTSALLSIDLICQQLGSTVESWKTCDYCSVGQTKLTNQDPICATSSFKDDSTLDQFNMTWSCSQEWTLFSLRSSIAKEISSFLSKHSSKSSEGTKLRTTSDLHGSLTYNEEGLPNLQAASVSGFTKNWPDSEGR